MKTAIMQPYFLPYIGYFQLIDSVDIFVIYDNIQYTKKGWINRNRLLINGQDQYFTLPIKKDSDYLNVNERLLSDEFEKEKVKLINKIKGAYSKAPYFKEVFPLVEEIINYKEENLFEYIYHSIKKMSICLGINTEFIKSSELSINIETYKGKEKVVNICKSLEATHYINPSGGIDLYDVNYFFENGIELSFIKSDYIEYKQFDNVFVPWLSIMDVIMFNDKQIIKEYLSKYKFI